MITIVLLSAFFLCFGNPSEKKNEYHKDDDATAEERLQAWPKNEFEAGYWRFYQFNEQFSKKGPFANGKRSTYGNFFSTDGKLMEEGHYVNDIKANWWLFYNVLGSVNHEFQWTNGKKSGYCVWRRNNTILKAQKYQDTQGIKAWSSFSGFKKEHKLSDLR